jgi:hypothetical protein
MYNVIHTQEVREVPLRQHPNKQLQLLLREALRHLEVDS